MSRKVLFVANTLRHLELCHKPYLKYFNNIGYEVHTVSDDDKLLDGVSKSYKISIKRTPYSLKNVLGIFQFRDILKKENYDIIHTHTPMGAFITRIVFCLMKKNNTKIIYTAHGFHFFKGCSIINYILYFPIEKLLSRYTDMIITINKEDYNFAKKHFKTNIKYVLGVGFDEDKFKNKLNKVEKNKLRNFLGLNDNDYIISYVAEISKRKRQDYLLKVISRMNITNEKFLFIGDDSNSYKIRKMIKKYNLDDVVKIIGFKVNISDYLDISDMIISVSKQEGLPLNIMEAMYKEKPIIVTNCRGNRDLINNMINGIVVDLNNKDELIESIKYLKNNKNITKNMATKNRELSNKYSIKTIMPKMEKIYKELMRK